MAGNSNLVDVLLFEKMSFFTYFPLCRNGQRSSCDAYSLNKKMMSDQIRQIFWALSRSLLIFWLFLMTASGNAQICSEPGGGLQVTEKDNTRRSTKRWPRPRRCHLQGVAQHTTWKTNTCESQPGIRGHHCRIPQQCQQASQETSFWAHDEMH